MCFLFRAIKNMKHERSIRSFSKQTQAYKITISHQASNLHIKAVNSLNQTQQKLYYDFNLPQSIKEECQTVQDLYDYLRDNSDIDFQIQHDFLKYKNAKLENSWYALPLNSHIDETTEQVDNSKGITSKEPIHQFQSSINEAQSNWENQKQQLIAQNILLKKKIAALNKRQRQRKICEKKSRLGKRKEQNTCFRNSFSVSEDINLNGKVQDFMDNFDFHLQVPPPVDIKLTVNKKCIGFQHYKMADDKITKTTQSPAILTFKQTVNRNQSKRFMIKIETELSNNWIIIGLLRKQLINRQFCYFIKNSIAYSGSMGIIFVNHDALDIGIIPSRGDLMQIIVHNKLHLIQWIINRQLICLHKIPESMLQHKLYPFIMLAHSRDTVRINVSAE